MLIRTILLILLFPALSAAQPLNTNGDFADATPGPVSGEDVTGWIIEVQSGSAEFEIVEEPVYASGHALKVTPAELGPDPWSLQVIADGIPVEPGQTYIYSVWARSESGGGTANFTVGNYDFHEYGRIGSSDVMLTDEWQEFTFTFTITDEESVIRAPIHFNFQGNINNPVYIDYLRILEEGAGILPPPVDIPLAEGKGKFLGNIYDQSQRMYFSSYWNQITPENGGKWGYVQPDSPDEFNWGELDAAYQLAKENNIPIRLHSLVWGNQQPRWMGDLSDDPDAQLEALERWMLAVAERYPDMDMVEVVNEPLHDPPTAQADGQGGDYFEALGGAGETGWNWVLTAFRMAREIFPETTQLMTNEYAILSPPVSTVNRYLELIELLQAEDLIDAIGVQGHAFSTRWAVSEMVEHLDILGETGLPVYITEMSLDGNPNRSPTMTQAVSDENQLEAFKRIFPALWEHPSVEGITFWGWRPGMWRSDAEAYLVREDGEERDRQWSGSDSTWKIMNQQSRQITTPTIRSMSCR